MRRPLWLDHAQVEHHCDRCASRVRLGDPLAWLPSGDEGELLCMDCACATEDEADAAAAALEKDRHDLTNGGYVRFHYNVPAHRGGRVVVDGKPGEIVGFRGQYLLVLFDGETEPLSNHPTWRVEYLADAAAVTR